jgi:hypothetical protein
LRKALRLAEIGRTTSPALASPATLPTSPIGRAIQHDRARDGLNVDQPRPCGHCGDGYVLPLLPHSILMFASRMAACRVLAEPPYDGARSRSSPSMVEAHMPAVGLAPSRAVTAEDGGVGGPRKSQTFAAPRSRGNSHFGIAGAKSVAMSSLRRDGVDFLGLGPVLDRLALRPGLQASEVEIDHRGRIQRQDLAESQSAHHGIAQRLA